MRRNENFILRQTADLLIILPVGEASLTFPGMISVNETGAFLWDVLEQEQTVDSLAAALGENYEVEPHQTLDDIAAFLGELRRAGALIE